MCHTTRVESVVFNTGLDEMRTDSNPSIHNGYQGYAGGPAVAHQVPCSLTKCHAYHTSLVQSISDARRNFSEQFVRDAINKLCVGDTANAICCLPPGTTLDEIIEKFKWLYGSVESFNTLMQEFYRIMQGNNERIQAFVLHLE